MVALEERYVVVTGGDRGIGRATVLRFARAGFNVVFTYRSRQDAAERTASDARAQGARSVLYYSVDVSSWESVSKFAQELSGRVPYVNVLVNNAGIIDYNDFEGLTPERWKEVLDVDLTGPFLVTKALLDLLRRASWASVVNLASIAGQTGNVLASVAYCTAKGGVIELTKRLAVELAKYGIRVNAVAPSFVETDMVADILNDPRRRREVEQMHPLGRIIKPEEVAEVIYFLADPALSLNITGQVIGINGGRYT
ncbi:3-oxoacyl-[acyl-carrier-protein] reductase [Acidilobus saccharovorans 345-15]|uniref:3-oxoacyl-[acyl-carrier-protein] reductase n=1 Tax=Acidilobus saccharovorans (strain DSM 16705 / JCM 18335 / VKM B-2471 / 345-15) TaxID=666510 RepID=D9Q0Y2_ACIS3|nr:3-oxoacyl-[acyl-carrier-protein] reductase [Acidilobus saccharovorans 345-15]